MPAPLAEQAVFGVPRPTTDPTIRQVTSAITSGANTVLGKVPLPGSVLVASSASTSPAGTPGVSGGGVTTWNVIDRVGVASGTQVGLNMFWGIVGAVPSDTVVCTFSGTGVTIVAEVQGLLGVFNSKVSSAGGATTTLADISMTPGGILIACFASRGTFTSFVLTQSSVARYLRHHINSEDNLMVWDVNTGGTYSLVATGGSNTAGIAAMLR